jgi:hypothetical protein
MASAVFFVNQRGEEIVSRHYRSDISRTSIDAFRSQVLAESPYHHAAMRGRAVCCSGVSKICLTVPTLFFLSLCP